MEIEELQRLFAERPLITTDSRDCPPGAIFIALKGASFNGNQYAQTALEAGCACAVVDERGYAGDPRCVLVSDCLQTLKDLARSHRRRFNIPILAITGTNGKTTTKELVSATLAKRLNTMHTEGNMNNDIGVPKTLLRLNAAHEMAVVEMGASHPGDIATLAATAEPQYGLITNVGRAHLQGFGSLEGVVKTKGELFDFLRSRGKGTAFVHAEDETLMGIAHGLDIVKYSTTGDASAYVSGRLTDCSPFVAFEWRRGSGPWRSVKTRLVGAYNLPNLLAAACVGAFFGVDESLIDAALAQYTPGNSRSQLTDTGHNRLVVDAYNANPTSMKAALDNFRLMKADKKMAILGDMGELGEASAEEHRRIVEQLEGIGADEVWLVGREFGRTSSAFRKFQDVDEVRAELNQHRPEGYLILIKGSHSQQLYSLPELL